MKVSEAKTKVCPFIQGINHGGWSRNNGEPHNINCIINKCMAWKWNEEGYHHEGLLQYRYSTTEGYCARIGQ